MNTHFNVSDQELAAATGGGWGFLAKLFIKQGVKQGAKQGAKQGFKRTARFAVASGVGGASYEGTKQALAKADPNEAGGN